MTSVIPSIYSVRPLLLMGLFLIGCSDQPDQVSIEPSAQVIEPSAQANQPSAQVIEPPAGSISQQLAEQAIAIIKHQPIHASSLDLAENLAGGPYSHRLTDYSLAGMQSLRKLVKDSAEILNKLAEDTHDESDLQNLQIVSDIYQYYAGAKGFDFGYIDMWGGHLPYIVNQISGPLIDAPKTMQAHQVITDLNDAHAYVQRLSAFENFTQAVLNKMESDAKGGLILPKVLMKNAIKFLRGFTQAPAKAHALVSALEEKLNKLEQISAEQKAKLLADASYAVEHQVYPGYNKVAASLTNLLVKSPEHAGIWAQPGGEAFYKRAIRVFGDTDLNAESIHQLGLTEVLRISSEMDEILQAQGFKEGEVGTRMVALGARADFLYADTDAGRSELLNDLNEQIAEINRLMPIWFVTIPPQKVEVRRIPILSQDGEAGGFYTSPSLDGSKPGIYWINLREMQAWPRFALNTLTYHEAVPGHHFQISVGMAQKSLPFFRRTAAYNAFNEGWALYSERLAWEMGLYKDRPFANLGRLQDELFRAVRLVVDTGLHHKRWTREQAIDYMYKITGSDLSEIIPEIERYMAWPGQALGYKLGMLKILDLRQKASSKLGQDFDIRQFHDVVLLGGGMPMHILQQNIDHWINTQLAD